MATKEHPHNYWNKEHCKTELAKYTRKLDAKYGSPGAYNSAYSHGWLEEIAPHLQSKTYWSKEKCFKQVKDKGYKTKKEFREDAPGCYCYAEKHGFLDKLCEGLEELGNNSTRKIYVFEFEDGYAYVGLSYKPERRKWQHLNDYNSAVYKHIRETQSKYVFKILTGWLSQKSAQKAEDHMINEYAHKGWKMLNVKKAGGLGSAREPKYKLYELIEEAKKYKQRSEFRRKSPAKYSFAYVHGLLDIVCANMPVRYVPHAIKWTKEKLDKAVVECKHSQKILKERYPGALLSIRKQNLIAYYFGKKGKTPIRRTLEDAIADCSKYKSVVEFKKADDTLYQYITHKRWSAVCFKNFKDAKIKKVNRDSLSWDDIMDKIKRCTTRKELKANYNAEYRTALKKPEWRAKLDELLPPRNANSLEKVQKICLQYDSPKELQKANPRIYDYIMHHRWQETCFAHMKGYHKHRKPFTWKEIFEKIKQCTKLKDFREKYPSEYNAACRREVWKKKLYELLIHRKHCVTFNDEEKMKIIASCKTKRQLHDNYRSVYDWLRLANRLNEFYPERIDSKS